MNNYIELTDDDDLLYKVVVKIENDKLFFEDGNYIDIGKGTGACCNYGSGSVTVIGDVKLPAVITKVETTLGEDDEGCGDAMKLTLFGEHAKMAEIDYSYYETGYYGSMTQLEVRKV